MSYSTAPANGVPGQAVAPRLISHHDGIMINERVNPQKYVAYYAAHRGITIGDIGVAPVVVLSWGERVIKSFADQVAAHRCPNWFYDEDHIVYPLFTGEVEGGRVSFALCPEGAPATVMMMEEMIACGARLFLGLGWAGSLQPRAPIGSLLIPTGCIREEGTSAHYLGQEMPISPDMQLVKLLSSAAEAEGATAVPGVQWTTDAPYRELQDKIESYRRQGVLGVDMETSAMYALGKYRKIQICNLLVVSDELWGEWRPGFRSPGLRVATALAQRIILRCVEHHYRPGQ